MHPLALALALAAPDPAAALLEADREMDLAVARHDGAAFEALVDPDALWCDGSGLLEGRGAVARAWAPLVAGEGVRLRWTPERAVLARSGDLGYTTGAWRLEEDARGGAGRAAQGRYVTVWRRGRDGAFRAVIDASVAPPRAGAARTAVRTLASEAGDLHAAVGTWTAPGGARGTFVSVRVRGAGGELAPALETEPALAAPAPQQP